VQNLNRPRVDPKQLRKSLLIWGIVAVVVIAGTQVGWGVIWREGLIRPSLNALLFLYAYLGRSFIVAITVFTVVLRLITMPLQVKQIRSAKRMSALQPRLTELQKRYGGDKERLMREQQSLYKEAGVSPFGGCLPTLVQFPIWVSLYQSINSILADTPLELMNLGKNIYVGFEKFIEVLPLQSKFLWLNLAAPDPTPFVLPVLVGGTMWLQQKMMTQPASSDSQQASMNQTMQVMMPLMFGYFTTQFQSGLALYFLISNVVGIIMQWAIERLEKPVTVSPAVLDIATPANDKEKAPYGRKKQRRKSKR